MTDKELRKLRREDLLQILIGQQKQIEELTAALQASEKALQDRSIAIEESGSIAEAALKLNDVFGKAQQAADQYAAQARARAEAAQAEADTLVDAAKQTAERIAEDARGQADAVLSEARKQADAILADARGEGERVKGEFEKALRSAQQEWGRVFSQAVDAAASSVQKPE